MSKRKPFITVYKAIGGWQTQLLAWDDECQMMAPWTTGNGPYGHSKEGKQMAIHEAEYWAEAEEIEFVKTAELDEGDIDSDSIDEIEEIGDIISNDGETY
jgi:hypothetical protein